MASKTESAKPAEKMHTLSITKGGAELLKVIVPSAGWYKGIPLLQAVAAQEAIQCETCDLKPPAAKEGDAKSFEAQDKWALEPWSCELNEQARDGIKACVKFYVSEARLDLTTHVTRLIVDLGIA